MVLYGKIIDIFSEMGKKSEKSADLWFKFEFTLTLSSTE